MCGIVGIAGDLNLSHREAFNDMLLVCQVRGRDSTGAFRVPDRGKPTIAKQVGTPEILLGSKAYNNNIEMFGRAYVGHCRSKTMGGATFANAHPFQHGHITGVHNGTLRYLYAPDSNDFGTDSEWLYHRFATEGAMKTMREDVDKDGAWALVWWDEQEETLNFLKNEQRPLWYTYTKDMKVMIWASETWMFGPFWRKHELWDGGEGKEVYCQVPNNLLISYKINRMGRTAKDIFTIVRMEEVSPKEVRRDSGNVRTHGSGSGNGGEVKTPFVPDGVRRTLNRMFHGTPDLDDNLPEMLTVGYVAKKGLPGLPQIEHKPVGTQGGKTPTPSQEKKSSKNSSTSTDIQTGQTSSKNSKPVLSLVPNNTSSSPSRSSESCCGNASVCSGSCASKKPQVSFRTVVGIPMISCRKTNREWSEVTFEQETDCICTFCKQPVGELEEVNEIFISTNRATKEEYVSFLCNYCVGHKPSTTILLETK